MRTLGVSLAVTLAIGPQACMSAPRLESQDAHLDAPVLVLRYVEEIPAGAVSAENLDPWSTDQTVVVAQGEDGDALVLTPAALSLAEVPALEGSPAMAGGVALAVPIVIGTMFLLDGMFVGVAVEQQSWGQTHEQMTAILEQGEASINEVQRNWLLGVLDWAGTMLGTNAATDQDPCALPEVFDSLGYTMPDGHALAAIKMCSVDGFITSTAHSISFEGDARGRMIQFRVWNIGPEPFSVQIMASVARHPPPPIVIPPGGEDSLWVGTDVAATTYDNATGTLLVNTSREIPFSFTAAPHP